MNNNWLHTTDATGHTLLERAMGSGCRTLVDTMVAQEKHDELTTMRQMPELHRAAFYGFPDVVEELIEDGHNVNEVDAHGETPLHKAARLENDEAVEVLLKAGASVNVADQSGMTPLHWAALNGYRHTAALLIMHGGAIDAQAWGVSGMTPIDLAMKLDDDELVTEMRTLARERSGRQAAARTMGLGATMA